MRNRYVVDAYAWVEYLRGSEAGRRVKAILEGGGRGLYVRHYDSGGC
ncbi:MAG: hypothetical protein QXG32_03655 [Candidatus Bathyarchaeia archaeon]